MADADAATTPDDTTVRLQVAAARQEESGQGIARMPRSAFQALGITEGDLVEITGKRATAAVVGYFAAGAMIKLRVGAPAPTQSCRVTGADAWSDGARLRYVAMTAIPGTERELEVDADGSFDAPGAPFDWFEVRSPDGQPLWSSRMEAICSLRVDKVLS